LKGKKNLEVSELLQDSETVMDWYLMKQFRILPEWMTSLEKVPPWMKNILIQFDATINLPSMQRRIQIQNQIKWVKSSDDTHFLDAYYPGFRDLITRAWDTDLMGEIPANIWQNEAEPRRKIKLESLEKELRET
jgi:hypothetical protein